MSKPKLRPDTGLAAMVAGAAGDDSGHLVLADWIEENLEAGDLAATLRGSEDDPRGSGKDAGGTSFHNFRWRQLDGRVMLYLATYVVYQPYVRGKKSSPPLEGRVVGFIVKPEGRSPGLRWARWLPTGEESEECDRLWEDLGVGVPVRPER